MSWIMDLLNRITGADVLRVENDSLKDALAHSEERIVTLEKTISKLENIEPLTVEEIIAKNSINMTDEQKAEYWYNLDQTIFSLLGKVEVELFELTPAEFEDAIKKKYPEITGIKIADGSYRTTTRDGILEILKRDWTNRIPYLLNVFDCDSYGAVLYSHFAQYYNIKTIIPVWGWVDQRRTYHGFNLAVYAVKADKITFDAQLIEPENDQMFDAVSGTWDYTADQSAIFLGNKT